MPGKKLLPVLFMLLLSCTSRTPGAHMNNRDKVVSNSKETVSRIFALDDKHDFKKLTSLDTGLVKQLSSFGVIAVTQKGYEEGGCHNQYYYHSYFQINENLTGAVFAQEICSCCGDDQLILALIDKQGNITDAIVAAEELNASECVYLKTTTVKDTTLIFTDKEQCGILEGADKDKTSIDSTTYQYTISSKGKFRLIGKHNVKLVRD